jgi:multiple sugar transport system substrate-binding protein
MGKKALTYFRKKTDSRLASGSAISKLSLREILEGAMNKKTVYAVAIFSLILLNACGAGSENAKKGALPPETSEPVTLKFMVAYGGFQDEEFQAYFVDQVKKKFPHITVEKVGGKLEDLISAGETPDILMSGLPGIPALQELKIIEDLNPYIKKFGVDLAKYDPVPIEAIRRFSAKGEMLALPFRMNIPALFYNKTIFDKFGIPYPKDGMTWEEVTALARKLTRDDGGVQYLGLYTGGADRMGMGLSLPYVDTKTNKAVLQTDGWQRVLRQYYAIHSVPGYVQNGKLANTHSMFFKEKTTAMDVYWGADVIGEIGKMYKAGQTFSDWDMVTIPVFDKGKGVAWQAETHNLLITSTSKHKDAAFQVISYIASDEVQRAFGKTGQIPVLKKTEELRKEYGSELPYLKGKHTDAFFLLQPGMHDHTKFDQKGRSYINEAAGNMLFKGVDVNTALREAEDKLNKYIEDELSK